jgi:hypothetical protein
MTGPLAYLNGRFLSLADPGARALLLAQAHRFARRV